MQVDVLLTPRDITKKSAVVDIDQWREHATDVFFSGVVPTFTDRSAANPLIRYYVRLDTVAQEIELEPYKNFMDLMEMLVRRLDRISKAFDQECIARALDLSDAHSHGVICLQLFSGKSVCTCTLGPIGQR